jgi:Gpi18-like mannosyltransferase
MSMAADQPGVGGGTDDPPPRGSGVSADPTRIRAGAPFCLLVFVILRVTLSAVAVIGVRASGPVPGVPTPGVASEASVTPGWHNALDGTDRFDAGWYIDISQHGYRPDDGSAAFLPLYPLSIIVVSRLLGGHELVAALLVSNVCFLLSLMVLHALTVEEYDLATARRSVVIAAAFPTSFFFLAPYSESLYLLLSLLTFRFARRRRWPASGVAGAAAAVTRSVGVALVPALAVQAWERRRAGDRWVPAAVAACAVLVGPVLYVVYWFARGSARAPLHAQAGWDRHLTFPLTALWRGLTLGIQGATDTLGRYWTADLIVTALAVVPLVVGWKRVRASYAVYAAVSLLLPLSYPLAARPLLSVPRFVAVLFPVYWIWATYLSTRTRVTVAIALSAGAWCVLALAFMDRRPFF